MRRDARSSFARIAVADHRAAASTGFAQTQRWPATCSVACRVDRHPVRAAHRHSMGDAAGGDGVRVGCDLLAATARLASGRGVAASAPRAAAPTARRRPHRLEPSLHGQLVRCGQKGGAATGPNPTDRGRPGTKRHLITDRRGIPLAFLLTGANVHDSIPFEELLDAVPPVGGKRGRPRSRPDKLHASFAWFNKFRRLAIRYERRLDMHHAFTSIACSIICLRALAGRF